jgi:ribosomal protein S27E
MVPLYAARIEDLGSGDFVKVDCAACGHTALLAPVFKRAARCLTWRIECDVGDAVSEAKQLYRSNGRSRQTDPGGDPPNSLP